MLIVDSLSLSCSFLLFLSLSLSLSLPHPSFVLQSFIVTSSVLFLTLRTAEGIGVFGLGFGFSCRREEGKIVFSWSSVSVSSRPKHPDLRRFRRRRRRSRFPKRASTQDERRLDDRSSSVSARTTQRTHRKKIGLSLKKAGWLIRLLVFNFSEDVGCWSLRLKKCRKVRRNAF